MRQFLVLALLPIALPAGAVTMDWALVGDPGNAPDAPAASHCLNAAPDCGSVSYAYLISKHEVTNGQYVEFLNAVADADPSGLYSTSMTSDARGGITRTGVSGSYSYAVKTGRENNPVVWVTFYDALRFANWLHNGQPTGAQGIATTEDGAYTITAAGIAANSITRNPGAITFLPTENEWYKAAYYAASTASYFDYATGTNVVPSSDPPPGGGNSANVMAIDGTYALTGSSGFFPGFNYLSDVGAYALSESPYGTFDQAGNVAEWNETATYDPFVPGPAIYRGLRGGGFGDLASAHGASSINLGVPGGDGAPVGFRVASLVPEPGTGLLVMTGLLGLAAHRRQRP